jgi:hypothetical protein
MAGRVARDKFTSFPRIEPKPLESKARFRKISVCSNRAKFYSFF